MTRGVRSRGRECVDIGGLCITIDGAGGGLGSLPGACRVILEVLELTIHTGVAPVFCSQLRIGGLVLTISSVSLLRDVCGRGLGGLRICSHSGNASCVDFLELCLGCSKDIREITRRAFIRHGAVGCRLTGVGGVLNGGLGAFRRQFGVVLTFRIHSIL